MIKSPLRYPGGKSKAVKFLASFFPQEFKELREPMFGGGSITFYWVQKKPRCRFLAGEINYDLYCFWKELKYNKDNLIREIKKIKSSYSDGRKLFNEIIERREKIDDFQRAVDFFILNRITFSGTVDSGGYSEQAFHKRFTWSSIERLEEAHKIIKEVELFYGDYEHLLFLPGKDVIIFLDPPYYSAQKSRLYGKRGNIHTEFDHIRFFKAISRCPHKILITYDNSPFIKELYKDYYIIEWELSYGMTNYKKKKTKKGKELLIANFPLKRRTQLLINFAKT
ncbi:DNA adenine methylase [Desulfurobacterium pacificum]|uniref:site-specific DNA-methyltransferase (adenine-specific) n=1 Tax=Desulfurobacterium pacificum TaxID=240166 RepID=A0ABY1NIY2_9BACT|nr:DNA adenine methylase [Desulfurobacterium pacificum]SMP10286.1 DNA adenine methylase [Desulfurobacterium pacificum]